ncbi:MAG TPA: sulfate ABC transporter substrate-binding protein [Acidimicrobiales bacterium]|nr:sulfate ABC transporter substrate-binding protein [Acidimicrobiales bacterium]
MHHNRQRPSAPGTTFGSPATPKNHRATLRSARVGLGTLSTLALATLALTAFTALPAGAQGGTVNLVAYSTPKPAFSVLAADFAKTKAGAGVSVSPSFGPSGTQATSVADGLPADLVNFSLEPDMDKVVKAGLVSSSWNKNATKGMVTDSIVSFVVRPGNPKHITTWADLVKSGVSVITPNVFSSGSAKWNIMAAYGAELKQGKTPAQAQTYLSQLLHHAVAQPSSASAALQTFLSGQGDVLLDYEDDALYAKKQGEPVQVITPPQTILIQNPIAVTKSASPAAKAFLSYLLSPAGQTVWGQQGYRPVLASVAAKFNFPQPKTLFTIDSLGGWTAVNTKFFDPQTGIVAHVEQSLGVSTASS